MFWWKIPITIISWTLGTTAVVSSFGVARYGLPLIFTALAVRNNYRPGEGPATEKFFDRGVFVDLDSEEPLGVILAQLSSHFDILPRPGSLYEMTWAEAEELRLLLVVIMEHPSYQQLGKEESSITGLLPAVMALQNCLERFPSSRTFSV